MKKLTSTCFLFFWAITPYAENEISLTTRLTKVYQYGTLNKNLTEDIAINVSKSNHVCADGFWIHAKTSSSDKMVFSRLLKAVESGKKVHISASDNYWAGSPYGRYCQVKSLRLLE